MPVAWIALNSIKGLGPVRFCRLLEEYKTPEAILQLPPRDLQHAAGITADAAAQVSSPQLLADAETQVKKAHEGGIDILTLHDDRYPALLREIFAPPPVLYVKGSMEAFAPHAIAMVGTRKPTTYGQNAAVAIAQDLTVNRVTIVSGLALGIDAICHQACLDGHGTTIAVLGNGLDAYYPVSNRRLGHRIVENGGAIVSEFPLGMPPEPYNYPRRNRIISGLAAGVCVIEAGTRSGSLITAHYALNQNRDVFAAPGPIFSEKSDGTFALLKSGATPVRCGQDILDVIKIPALQIQSLDTASRTDSRLATACLSAAEQLVLQALSSQPQRLDQIAEKTSKVVAELFSILLNLELKGFISQVAGQHYIRN